MRISAHAWKRLLDQFYRIVLQDNQLREDIEDELEERSDHVNPRRIYCISHID